MKIWQARLGLLGVAFLWGLGYILSSVLLEYMDVFQLNFYRFLISTIAFMIVWNKKIIKNLNKQIIIAGIIVGFSFFLGMTLLTEALNTTTVSKNSFLVMLNIVLVPIISFIMFKYKVKIYYFFGMITICIGFFVLLFVDFNSWQQTITNFLSLSNLVIGDYMSLISSFFFALQIVLIGYYVKKFDVITLVTLEMFFTSLFSLAYSLIAGYEMVNIFHLDYIYAMVFLLVLGVTGVLSFGGQTYIQKYLSATDVAIIFSTESLFATLLSILLGWETFTLNLLIGGALVTLGVIWAETGFKFKSSKKQKKTENI